LSAPVVARTISGGSPPVADCGPTNSVSGARGTSLTGLTTNITRTGGGVTGSCPSGGGSGGTGSTGSTTGGAGSSATGTGTSSRTTGGSSAGGGTGSSTEGSAIAARLFDSSNSSTAPGLSANTIRCVAPAGRSPRSSLVTEIVPLFQYTGTSVRAGPRMSAAVVPDAQYTDTLVTGVPCVSARRSTPVRSTV
jgi:hypothetical protein